MSSKRTVTCDRCGQTKVDDESSRAEIMAGMPVDPWWHLQFTSSDFTAGGDRKGFRMKFISWDLCTECASEMQTLLRESAGVPGFESTDD